MLRIQLACFGSSYSLFIGVQNFNISTLLYSCDLVFILILPFKESAYDLSFIPEAKCLVTLEPLSILGGFSFQQRQIFQLQ